MNKLTSDYLHSILAYDPFTGIVTWAVDRNGGAYAGDTITSPNRKGYFRVGIDGVRYYLHNVIWLYMTGDWPPEGMEVDHQNFNRADNAWTNLRLITKTQNRQCRRMFKSNKVGLKGVSIDKKPPKGREYRAQIRRNGKQVTLGWYATAIEAHAKYCEAAREAYGEYACLA